MSSTFYAAFRHVELDNIGYGKKRVLKPPGGGSSDIFGGEENGTSPSRPITKHHLKSSLFAEPQAISAPTTNGSSEPITNGTTNGTTNGHTTPKGKNVARNPVTGEGIGDSLTRSARKRVPMGVAVFHKQCRGEGRNPVTGETYASDERDSSCVQPRNRVPPGGYTTPLW